MGEIKEYRKKILLIGDGAVGKTSLIRRLVVDIFDDNYITTIGTKITIKELQVNVDKEPIYLKLLIWDILGQKGYTKLYNASFIGAKGVLFVTDITRKETLESLKKYWIPQVEKICGNVPFIILANKADLMKKSQFGIEELEEFALELKAPYYLTSAKSGKNVNEAFNTIGTLVLQPKRVSKSKIKGHGIIEEEMNKNAYLIDRIIHDFCNEYGELEDAMPIIRRQFERANLDLNNPKKDALVSVVEKLADVEAGFKKIEVAEKKKKKRLRWIKET
jgi:small GTP-binding protein